MLEPYTGKLVRTVLREERAVRPQTYPVVFNAYRGTVIS